MSFDGIWNVTVESPMGEQPVKLEISTEGGVIKGTASLGRDTSPFLDPVLEGDRLRWKVEISKPMSMTIAFDLTRDGDTVKGTAKPGFFPAGAVKGERA